MGSGPSRPGRTGAAPAGQATVVPRQLPAGVAHFAGRTAELSELAAWQQEAASADGAAKVLVIGGTAGAGKTALAVHWAHQSAGEFPDGQLYVNLRGFDPSGTPVAAGDALRWFLGAFGVTEEQIRTALTRSPPCTGACWPTSGCWSSWTTRVTPPRCGRCCRAAGPAWPW